MTKFAPLTVPEAHALITHNTKFLKSDKILPKTFLSIYYSFFPRGNSFLTRPTHVHQMCSVIICYACIKLQSVIKQRQGKILLLSIQITGNAACYKVWALKIIWNRTDKSHLWKISPLDLRILSSWKAVDERVYKHCQVHCLVV